MNEKELRKKLTDLEQKEKNVLGGFNEDQWSYIN